MTRQPKGIPVGGQFAASARNESATDLLVGTAYDTRAQHMDMSRTEFTEMFGGIVPTEDGHAVTPDPPDDDTAEDRIWTVSVTPEDSTVLVPGSHGDNPAGYVVTAQPWGNPDIAVPWDAPGALPSYVEARENFRLCCSTLKAATDAGLQLSTSERNNAALALASTPQGRNYLASMLDTEWGLDPWHRKSLIDYGAKQERLIRAYEEAGIGVDPQPITVAEARRRLPLNGSVEVHYLQMNPGQPETRVITKQNASKMVSTRTDGTDVHNDWAKRKASVDAAGNINIADEFGNPYVTYRPLP